MDSQIADCFLKTLGIYAIMPDKTMTITNGMQFEAQTTYMSVPNCHSPTEWVEEYRYYQGGNIFMAGRLGER